MGALDGRVVAAAKDVARGPVSTARRWAARARAGASLYERLPDGLAVRLAYDVLLERAADPAGFENYVEQLHAGKPRAWMLDELRWSMEAHDRVRPRNLLVSLHLSRCDFVRSLPRAGRILDLGGSHQSSRDGAFVRMGYPYRFERLVLVDLPHDERHELYQHSEAVDVVETELGPVEYQYHSMADLSRYDDASFDLVYSGQTIEHVTPDECDVVLKEVFRVLRPGGRFALDTPNGPVCRLQSDEMTNPDHKVEYSDEEMRDKLVAAGFAIEVAAGLNLVVAEDGDGFSEELTSARRGLYAEAARCYLLAYVAAKPG